ncbi:MAG: hypothetical protein ACREPV_03910 [Lysobacter sp.]
MIPVLPVEAIHRALDAGEWDMAAELLADHEHEVRTTLADTAPHPDNKASWLALLAAQRELLAQLTSARSETAQSLQRLGRDRRGAQAYLDAG